MLFLNENWPMNILFASHEFQGEPTLLAENVNFLFYKKSSLFIHIRKTIVFERVYFFIPDDLGLF